MTTPRDGWGYPLKDDDWDDYEREFADQTAAWWARLDQTAAWWARLAKPADDPEPT